jgi:hypothetical protein
MEVLQRDLVGWAVFFSLHMVRPKLGVVGWGGGRQRFFPPIHVGVLETRLVFSGSRGTTVVLFEFVPVYCRRTKKARNDPCFNIR